ncbi:MAG: PAS domain S-box protein, partial [Acidimicrobiales bacterium]
MMTAYRACGSAVRVNDRRDEQSYAAIVENAPICIHEIDLDGRLTSMNPAGLAMLGTTLDAV